MSRLVKAREKLAPKTPGTWAHMLRTVAIETGSTLRDVRRIAEVLLEVVKDETWQRGRIVVPGFATFNVRRAKARRVVDPVVHEVHRIRATKVVKVRAAKAWRTR